MSTFPTIDTGPPPKPRTAAWYFQERQQRQRRKKHELSLELPSLAEVKLQDIANHEKLIKTFYQMKQSAGQAPGLDGLRYPELSRRQVPAIMREVQDMLLRGVYVPGPGRKTPIPKKTGGHRTLTIRSVIDRVVATAVHNLLTPLWDPLFLEGSYGFRPGRGVWHMLAAMEYFMDRDNQWVLAVDDVKAAFDNLSIPDLMDDHRRQIQDERLLNLIEVILRGGHDPSKEVGIDQGSAYSPTCLNIRLHHALDAVYGEDCTKPLWFRYADNLVYLCRNETEGNAALYVAGRLLKTAGLTLKGGYGPPADLRLGDRVQVLGFVLSTENGRLRYRTNPAAWNSLQQELHRTHLADNPPRMAKQVILGWINAMSPTLESWQSADWERLHHMLTEIGLTEILSRYQTDDTAWDAWRDWVVFLRKHHSLLRQRYSRLAAPPAATMPGG